MRLFLAYGNSDQASFRTEDVRAALDFVTVPGTIAAYYPDATAGFILTSGLDYVIDPRTPLFQGQLIHPKASYYELARWLGPRFVEQMGDRAEGLDVNIGPSFFSPQVIEEAVSTITEAQRTYSSRESSGLSHFDRYRQLLAEALSTDDTLDSPGASSDGGPPSFILAPYFAAANAEDPWWQINAGVWEACRSLPSPGEISPVLCVTNVGALSAALSATPSELSSSQFFWVTSLNEREADEGVLQTLWDSVEATRDSRQLINLYGGFFSVCLSLVGLEGVNHGLGYSEYREWPALSATGAAPPRYYVRDLHAFFPPARAQLIVQAAPSLACPCPVCLVEGQPRPPALLGYHDLKRHFALARRWEIDRVSGLSADEVGETLSEAVALFDREVIPNLPQRLQPNLGFLARWEAVLRRATSH